MPYISLIFSIFYIHLILLFFCWLARRCVTLFHRYYFRGKEAICDVLGLLLLSNNQRSVLSDSELALLLQRLLTFYSCVTTSCH